MADGTQRSTGNRRAVRNALFRSMMADTHQAFHRRKLRESDLTRARIVFGPPLHYQDPTNSRSAHEAFISQQYLDACREMAARDTIQTHPLLRWWRRLLWGE